MVCGVDGQKIPQGILVLTRSGTVQDVLIVENVWRKVLSVAFNTWDVLLSGSYQFSFELLKY